MTATSACLVELEALRERLSGIIRELKHAERMIEVFDVIAPVVPAQVASAAPAKVASKAFAAQPPSPAGPARGKRAEAEEKILALLRRAGEPLKPIAIIRGTKLPRSRVFGLLPSLMGRHLVLRAGTGRACTSGLAQPRPGAVAGTQAAPPVGPSSANGSTGGNGRQASSAPFEVAWNGTKDRSGEAPSLLPPRERRA